MQKKTEEVFSYAISDLESCYDRQLPKIGGVVEKSVGVNREAINWSQKACIEVNITYEQAMESGSKVIQVVIHFEEGQGKGTCFKVVCAETCNV